MEEFLIANKEAIFVLAMFSLALKAIALWRAGKHGRLGWFIALLFVNTLGILELIYIFCIDKPSALNERQLNLKEAHLAVLRDYLKTHEQVTSQEIQKLIGVSAATTVRYLDELEKDGLLEQVGDTGRGVIYRKK